MKKIFIAFILIVSFSESILSQERWTGRTYIEEYQKAKETTDEDFLTNIETYLYGIVKGIVTTNLFSGVIGEGNLFCLPKNKSFKPNEVINLISELDEDFKQGKTIYPNDPLTAPIEITMIWALRHFYPCSNK